jgi:formate hydrogenlyase subunit 3/multisubunit Na+/H+ antiporter MnhD subunit
MSAMTIAAFGMIGVPPVAGFVSKWYLGLGGLKQGEPWVVVVLLVSSLLNAWYFLPVLYAGWFKDQKSPVINKAKGLRQETWGFLLWPAVTTALFSLFAGLFAAAEISPLKLAERIAVQLYNSP